MAEVAVPARGAGCIQRYRGKVHQQQGCRPRKGCGLYRVEPVPRWIPCSSVAVPARGAGCIKIAAVVVLALGLLPSPRGVRVTSCTIVKEGAMKPCCRPREGCGLHPAVQAHLR